LTTHYSERLQSTSFNMKESENKEELTDKAVNINNKWITAFSVLTVELNYIKISVNVQHHRSDAKQLKYYSMIN